MPSPSVSSLPVSTPFTTTPGDSSAVGTLSPSSSESRKSGIPSPSVSPIPSSSAGTPSLSSRAVLAVVIFITPSDAKNRSMTLGAAGGTSEQK